MPNTRRTLGQRVTGKRRGYVGIEVAICFVWIVLVLLSGLFDHEWRVSHGQRSGSAILAIVMKGLSGVAMLGFVFRIWYRLRRGRAPIWDHWFVQALGFFVAYAVLLGATLMVIDDVANLGRTLRADWFIVQWQPEIGGVLSIVNLGLLWLLWPWNNPTQVLILRAFAQKQEPQACDEMRAFDVVRRVAGYFGRVDGVRSPAGRVDERYGLSGSPCWRKGVSRLMDLVELVVLDVSVIDHEEETLRHPSRERRPEKPEDELTGRAWELCEIFKHPKTPHIFIAGGPVFKPMLASEKRVDPCEPPLAWTDADRAKLDEFKQELEEAKRVLATEEVVCYQGKSDREFAVELLGKVEQVCKVRRGKWARHRARVLGECDVAAPAAGVPA